MIKRFLCSTLAGVMLCAPLVVSAAEVRHVHTYGSYTNDMEYHSSCGQGYVD